MEKTHLLGHLLWNHHSKIPTKELFCPGCSSIIGKPRWHFSKEAGGLKCRTSREVFNMPSTAPKTPKEVDLDSNPVKLFYKALGMWDEGVLWFHVVVNQKQFAGYSRAGGLSCYCHTPDSLKHIHFLCSSHSKYQLKKTFREYLVEDEAGEVKPTRTVMKIIKNKIYFMNVVKYIMGVGGKGTGRDHKHYNHVPKHLVLRSKGDVTMFNRAWEENDPQHFKASQKKGRKYFVGKTTTL